MYSEGEAIIGCYRDTKRSPKAAWRQSPKHPFWHKKKTRQKNKTEWLAGGHIGNLWQRNDLIFDILGILNFESYNYEIHLHDIFTFSLADSVWIFQLLVFHQCNYHHVTEKAVFTSLASLSYSSINLSFSWFTASTLQIRFAAVSAYKI